MHRLVDSLRYTIAYVALYIGALAVAAITTDDSDVVVGAVAAGGLFLGIALAAVFLGKPGGPKSPTR